MNQLVQEYLPLATEQPMAPEKAKGVGLGQLRRPLPDDDSELLRHRFLCRGAGLLLVGATGIGKSSFSMQAMLNWALGRQAFGVEPARALKSLLIQAENDDGDLAEMRDGVVNGLELSTQDAEMAFSRITVCREDAQTGAGFFANTVRPLLEEHRPDLLWVDPVLAYLAGEANAQQDVGGFLRNRLNPLIREFNCAVVVVHHTNKPPKKGDSGWSGGDYAYLGAGSAEWANWSRAVLALQPTGAEGIFELKAAKRGGRLQWRAPDGESRVFSQFIAHTRTGSEIYWREATEPEKDQASSRRSKQSFNDHTTVLAAIPRTGSIEKKVLLQNLKNSGLGRDRALAAIEGALTLEHLHEVQVKRQNARPRVHLALGPPPKVLGQETGYSGCYDGSKSTSSNSQEERSYPEAVVTTDGPPLGAVVTTAGITASTGGNQEEPINLPAKHQVNRGPSEPPRPPMCFLPEAVIADPPEQPEQPPATGLQLPPPPPHLRLN